MLVKEAPDDSTDNTLVITFHAAVAPFTNMV